MEPSERPRISIPPRVARIALPALRVAVPIAIAFLLIAIEPLLSDLAASRPGVLPVAMVAVVCGLLVQRIRRWLITTLCFGIALLAAHDALWTFQGPAPPTAIERYIPYGWAVLAVLAGLAGLAEALRPGSVWARRCYFGAAAFYFLGHGLVSLVRGPNWESIVLMVTGSFALAGVFLAHRIVEAEATAEQEDEDIRELAERSARRGEKLAAKEWQDTPDDLPKASSAQ